MATKIQDLPADIHQPGMAEATIFFALDKMWDDNEEELELLGARALDNTVRRQTLRKRDYNSSRVQEILKRLDPEGLTSLSKHYEGDHDQSDHGNWADDAKGRHEEEEHNRRSQERDTRGKVTAERRLREADIGEEIGRAASIRGNERLADLLEGAERAGRAADLNIRATGQGPAANVQRFQSSDKVDPKTGKRTLDHDAFIDNLGLLLDRPGDAAVISAWKSEFDRIAAQKTEVGKLVEGLRTLSGTYMDQDKQSAKTVNLLTDLADIIGPNRVQDGYNRARATVGSGGRITGDDLTILGDEFRDHPDVGRRMRIEAVSDWIQDSNKQRGGFLAAIRGSGPSNGFIVDSKTGDVVAGYHGRNIQLSGGKSPDEVSPFNLRGLFQSRGNDVVRGRYKGGLTNSDMLWAAITGQRSTTVASKEGKMSAQFSWDGMSLLDRFAMYRQFKNYNKLADKHQREDPSDKRIPSNHFDRTASIFKVMTEQYPRHIKFSADGEERRRESSTPMFDAVSKLQRVLSDDDLYKGTNLPLAIENETKNAAKWMKSAGFSHQEIQEQQNGIKEAMTKAFLSRMATDFEGRQPSGSGARVTGGAMPSGIFEGGLPQRVRTDPGLQATRDADKETKETERLLNQITSEWEQHQQKDWD